MTSPGGNFGGKPELASVSLKPVRHRRLGTMATLITGPISRHAVRGASEVLVRTRI